MKYFFQIVCISITFLSCSSTATNFEEQEANQSFEQVATEVRVQNAEVSSFLYAITAKGKLASEHESILYSKTTGILTSLNVKTGAWVKKGSVLAQIENDKQKICLNYKYINIIKVSKI